MSEPYIVIDENRDINVPEELRERIVQFDHNVETFTFQCPRHWDGRDLSTMKIFVNYVIDPKKGTCGAYLVKELNVNEADDNMTFDWVVTQDATTKEGELIIFVCTQLTDELGNLQHHWSSNFNKDFKLAKSYKCLQGIVDNYPNIIGQILADIDKLKENGGSVTFTYNEATGDATFGNETVLAAPEGIEAHTEIVSINGRGLQDAVARGKISELSEEIAKKVNPTDEQISEAVSGWLDEHPEATTTVVDGSITEEKLHPDLTEKLGASKPQWAEFPRLTNPARDIYNAFSVANKKTLGTDGTLRHNLMIHGALMTWTESTGSVDYADSSGSASVKLCGWYDKFGTSHIDENSNIIYTDALDVFPHGSDIYGVDGAVIDTVVASSDSTIIDLGGNNYVIMAGCQGASSYHMIYREVSYVSRTITLGDTINVLTINGAEWDMTTLRDDYYNKYSQLNTKVIKTGGYYYMAMVQSGVGIAIMKSSDGKEWTLNNHIEDTDCHLEACIGTVSWQNNTLPTAYVVVRHKYGDGYITLYGFAGIGGEVISKTFIPASTGRALLDSVNGKDIYLAYSVNGRKNAVLAQILPNSDGTTGVSILETPKEVMSNYPTLYAHRSYAGTYSIMFGGTDGLNKNGSSISCAYLWNENNDVLNEKNEQLKKVMFGTSVEVVQTLTEGTEIGSVGGTKLYAPKASSGGGATPTLQLLGNTTVTEDTASVDFTFSEPLNLKKIMVYANTKGVADFSSQARGLVYINNVKVADGFDNNSFNNGATKHMLFDIDILENMIISKTYMENMMGGGYSSDNVAFLTTNNIDANTDITKISFKANFFDGVAIASGTTVSVYGY